VDVLSDHLVLQNATRMERIRERRQKPAAKYFLLRRIVWTVTTQNVWVISVFVYDVSGLRPHVTLPEPLTREAMTIH